METETPSSLEDNPGGDRGRIICCKSASRSSKRVEINVTGAPVTRSISSMKRILPKLLESTCVADLDGDIIQLVSLLRNTGSRGNSSFTRCRASCIWNHARSFVTFTILYAKNVQLGI